MLPLCWRTENNNCDVELRDWVEREKDRERNDVDPERSRLEWLEWLDENNTFPGDELFFCSDDDDDDDGDIDTERDWLNSDRVDVEFKYK